MPNVGADNAHKSKLDARIKLTDHAKATIFDRLEYKIGGISRGIAGAQGIRTDLTSSHDGKKSEILKKAGFKSNVRSASVLI